MLAVIDLSLDDSDEAARRRRPLYAKCRWIDLWTKTRKSQYRKLLHNYTTVVRYRVRHLETRHYVDATEYKDKRRRGAP